MRCTVASPRPDPAALRGEERLEDPLEDVGRDAHARRRRRRSPRSRPPRRERFGPRRRRLEAARRRARAAIRDPPPSGIACDRVQDQVPEHLPQLARVGERHAVRRRPAIASCDARRVATPRTSSPPPRRAARDRERRELGGGRPRVMQEVGDQVVEALDLAEHDAPSGARRSGPRRAAPVVARSISSEPEIAASGLRISWAMLAASWPVAASRSERRSSRLHPHDVASRPGRSRRSPPRSPSRRAQHRARRGRGAAPGRRRRGTACARAAALRPRRALIAMRARAGQHLLDVAADHLARRRARDALGLGVERASRGPRGRW